MSIRIWSACFSAVLLELLQLEPCLDSRQLQLQSFLVLVLILIVVIFLVFQAIAQ
jgi:hypothetical protein